MKRSAKAGDCEYAGWVCAIVVQKKVESDVLKEAVGLHVALPASNYNTEWDFKVCKGPKLDTDQHLVETARGHQVLCITLVAGLLKRLIDINNSS